MWMVRLRGTEQSISDQLRETLRSLLIGFLVVWKFN